MELIQALIVVLKSLLTLLATLGRELAPWTPLFAWVAFWTLAVDWTKLYPLLMRKGAIIGVLLLAFMAVLVWSVVAPPPDGVHHIFGLSVSNVTGKLMYVTAIVVIAFLCGSVQLSGACASLLRFEEPALAEAHDDHGHGHDDHGHGHGHDSHGH
jgi:hypothetical protein